MKKEYAILIIEDEPEVRDALERDLQGFNQHFRIESAEDVPDARQVLRECDAEGIHPALLLCDHVLPGTRGVDFLVELQQAPDTVDTRKVLVTGQAGLEDTIRAVNEAHLHHYVAKPWKPGDLLDVVRDQLTAFVLDHAKDLLPYVAVLDGPRLMEALSRRRSDT